MNRIATLRGAVAVAAFDVDRFMARRLVESDLRGAEVQCREGCSACCYILATVTLPEAIHLVATLRDQGHEFDSDSVRDQFESVIDPSMDLTRWHHAQHPCIALDGDRCAAYGARPQTCRAHYVISPRSQCSPPTQGYMGIDSRGFMDVGMPPLIQAAQQAGIPLAYAPLPFLVPIAIAAVDQGLDVATEKLRAMGMDSDEAMMRWLNFAA